ncbi:MAG: SUMF1/EgtB/PvdO family nonheme iron enzyme [Bacteroidales bacterium]
MDHDVFISYSSKNKQTADAICHVLEQHKIKCWIAPRDISIGDKYGNVIEQAICTCKVFIIIFSKESSLSQWVGSELNIAFTDCRVIMPFRIDSTRLEGEMRLMLNNKHWIDAYPAPEERFAELVSAVAREVGLKITPSASPLPNDDLPFKREQPLRAEEKENQKTQQKTCPNPACKRTGLSGEAVYCPFCSTKLTGSGSNFVNFTETVNGVTFDMLVVEGGTFMMGSNDGGDDERPIHKVTLYSFCIGKYPVTQKLWQLLMENNPSHFKGYQLPVDQVSWANTQEFIQKLNFITGKNYRLPTEAEWEYAARGGNQSRGYTYSGSNIIDDVAWYNSNSGGETHHVGQKHANELGLYDMNGNVWEWCNDWYSKDYYASSPESNPQGLADGYYRVNRGGSWYNYAQGCRASDRGHGTPVSRCAYLGFRLVLVP